MSKPQRRPPKPHRPWRSWRLLLAALVAAVGAAVVLGVRAEVARRQEMQSMATQSVEITGSKFDLRLTRGPVSWVDLDEWQWVLECRRTGSPDWEIVFQDTGYQSQLAFQHLVREVQVVDESFGWHRMNEVIGVTKDGARTWENFEYALPEFPIDSMVSRPSKLDLAADGTGTMQVNVKDRHAHERMRRLVTSDFGRTWQLAD